jgi:DNA-binding CsgD family transcriptional regulator
MMNMAHKSSVPSQGIVGRPAFGGYVNAGNPLLTALFNSSTVGVAICDRQLRFRAINDALASMNGIPAKKHLGKTIHAVLGSAAAKIQPAFDHVFATGQPLSDVEVIAELPTRGTIGHWSESYFPIKDQTGEVREVGAVVLELTRGKELEASLSRLTDKLVRVNSRIARPFASATAGSADLLENCLVDARNIWHLLQAAPSLAAVPPGHLAKFLRVNRADAAQNQTLDFASVYPVQCESGVNPLSSREHEVFALLARGNTNKEIAAVLTISIRTVETHRARIMLKLDLHSVTDLVLYALRNHLIQP